MGEVGRFNAYENDITIVKQLGDYLKVVNISSCRIEGLELDITHTKKNSVNTEKLQNNIVRAKTKVLELALCNPWEFFGTFTIDKSKYDRYNLKAYYKDFAEFLHIFNRRRIPEERIKYLLIPEMHKDGAWHMHGLIKGLQPTDLYINSNGYLGWKEYERRFGYISLGKIRDKDKTSFYITKYITKELNKTISNLGCHLYYSSKGLQVAEELYRGRAELLCNWDYEHPDGYCKVKTFNICNDNYTDFLKLV